MPNDSDLNAGELNDAGVTTPVVVPDDLVGALVAWLRADATVTALLGAATDVWGDLAPAGRTGSYLVASERMALPEYESPDATDSAPYTAVVEVQLSAFATTRAAARKLARAAVKSCRDADLTFAEGTCLRLRPARWHEMRDPDLGPGSKPRWQHVVFLTATVASPPP